MEKRQGSAEFGDYYRALRVKAWSVETARRVDRMWRNVFSNYQRMEAIFEMFAGGPLKEWMWDYRVVRINNHATKYNGL